MPDALQQVKTACAYIGGPNPGTGYVVAQNRLATCHHVVQAWKKDETNPVWFGAETGVQQARVLKSDETTDSAVLEFDGRSPAPLPMAGTLEGKAVWEGYGFPKLANATALRQTSPTGLPLDGEVMDASTTDDKGRHALLLFSQMIAAARLFGHPRCRERCSGRPPDEIPRRPRRPAACCVRIRVRVPHQRRACAARCSCRCRRHYRAGDALAFGVHSAHSAGRISRLRELSIERSTVGVGPAGAAR